MKTLYEFTSYKKEKVKEEVVTKDDEGNEVKSTKEVEKEVPYTFAIRKPTRSLFDEGELFYGIRLAEGVKAGLLTRQMLNKRYLNDGGSKSEMEESYERIVYALILEKQTRFQELEVKKDLTDEEKEELEELRKDIAQAQRQAQKYEAGQSSLFDQTAENRARNKTITWWALNLCYRKVEKKQEKEGDETTFDYQPFFGEGSYEDRLSKYDDLEEKDDKDFDVRTLKRFFYLISFWYVGRANKFQDFLKLEESLKEEAKDDEEVAEFASQELNLIEPQPKKAEQ
ncbi:MAG: hypothetical protein DWQ49_05935 [Bacteroidetes bacterium]|nr:MAG: hypothetical protein DWQ49_05935 [Bacteroidota bacterium]